MQLRSTHAMTELARVNVELYSSLEAETGQATGFKQNGTLGVCRTRERLHETMRTATLQFVELPEDWDQFMLPMTRAMEMIPALESAGIARFMNGPESFTPDLLFALGEVPGRRNCFVSAGYNSDADLSNDGFPFSTSREIDVGQARVVANRLTYVGELGWELFVPTEFAQGVCDRLLAEGEDIGFKPSGYHALEHLRSERAYREYELYLTPEDTPFETGLGFTVRLDKPHEFIGRDALLRQKAAGPLARRLVMFKLKDPEPVLFGEEVTRMDGRIAGCPSSGAYGFTLGASVGMGYICHPDGVTRELIESASWEIEIAWERYPAEASLPAFYDPAGARVRS